VENRKESIEEADERRRCLFIELEVERKEVELIGEA